MAENMGNSSSMWMKTFEEIKDKHDLAFVAIDEAIRLEENEKPNEAIEKYKQGIELIDLALNIQVTCPETPDITWEKACVMIQKIKKTRAEVLMRINSIQSVPGFIQTLTDTDPPSYDEAMSSLSSDSSDVPRTYRDLATALNELSIDPNLRLEEEVIYLHDGVRIYFINSNGEVTSTEDPQTLKISLVEAEGPNAPKAILQVGNWVYPLVPGVSPCFRTDYGAFILPNLEEPGSSIGIILPEDADSDVFDLLENILHGIIGFEKEPLTHHRPRQRRELPTDTSSKISTSIQNGAWYLSQGLIKGAEKAGDLINYGTPKLINTLQPATQPTHINPKLQKGIHMAETATSKAVVVTGFVADKVGFVTMKLGKFLAPHIQKGGTKLLTSSFNISEQEASDKMKGVLTVTAGAVEGFSTVYRGLETSASILGNNLKANTVKVVNHKYGKNVGCLTDDTLNTVGNVYSISQHSKIITPKGLAKRTGKDMGKAVIRAYNHTVNHSEPNMTPGTSGIQSVPITNHPEPVTYPNLLNTQHVDPTRPLLPSGGSISPTDEKRNFQNF
ncbi:unnamed protein product [Brassicogethes aeneus]|uniref:MIT domain-containing protein n=1 Tax=Brassicogethes aeneus TaxID=1431903 RepID=A0A9P0FF20_BRAAE|nr:unnamed protein product [Brassicogethes aeneus]